MPQEVRFETRGSGEERSGSEEMESAEGRAAKAKEEFVCWVMEVAEGSNRQPLFTVPEDEYETSFCREIVSGGKMVFASLLLL